MTGHDDDEPLEDMTDSEAALLDTVRILYDVLIQKKVIKAQHVDHLLQMHQKNWIKKNKPRAVGILGLLRALSTSEKVLKQREAALKLYRAQPKGSA